MKKFLKSFKVCFIILGVLAVFYFGLTGIHSLTGSLKNGSRENTECTTEERVFDLADVLSDKEEEKLRKLIARREAQTGCDIVLVTLNESLREYAYERQEYVAEDKYVMIYADDFYDEHMFGYDKPQGNGVLFLDNLHREDDGWAYSWLCTTGKAEGKYSSSMIDHLLEKSYRWSKLSPYLGYKAYINQFYHDMNGFGFVSINFSVPIILIVSLVTAVGFVLCNLGSEAGKKTTTANTYVKNGKVKINHREDRFIRKSVAQHRIQNSSSGGGHGGGGGGHHVSSGGVSHGGGGHRH
ncbi:MAG: TPM domain-containing protein [Lachnospiraceae bacterium]|nr:TPM domain-containing protein [Lachnospiraceae bacterium]